MKTFKLITLLLFGLLCYKFNQPLYCQNNNPQTFQANQEIIDIDRFIRYGTPRDSALKIINSLALRNHLIGKSILSMYLYKIFEEFFPDYKDYFQRQIRFYEEYMLAQKATFDLYSYYEMYIIENAPSRNAFIALQRLTAPYIDRKSWDTAIALYRSYQKFFPVMHNDFEEICSILSAGEENLILENLVPNINTALNEWDPNPTPDGKYLYFTASHRVGGKGGNDVWVSEWKDAQWQKAKNIGPQINTHRDETIDNVTADGTGLFLSGTLEGSFGNYDIYYAELTEKGWGNLQHFPYPINTKYTDEAANLTSDGKALIFASDRPGGIGQFLPFGTLGFGSINGNEDIYISFKTDTGWSEPINLGPIINTPYSERAPYLHPDGKTLYISSEGHPGIGGLDVFVSRRLSDTSWTKWSKPINLGKEINSSEDDLGYKIDIYGEKAFFASRNRPRGYGNLDIYSITLPLTARPDHIVVIKGKVTDLKGNPLKAKIVWEDLKTGEIMGILNTNPIAGTYVISLPVGKHYGYYATCDGYYPSSRNIDLSAIKALPGVTEDITLPSIDEIKSSRIKVLINNVFFDFDRFDLKLESFPELNRLASFLNMPENQDLKIEIEGHTDIVGSNEYNFSLSEKRAKAVSKYLIDKGCYPNRIRTKGYGATQPIDSNDSPEGRAKNRRVVIWFIRDKN